MDSAVESSVVGDTFLLGWPAEVMEMSGNPHLDKAPAQQDGATHDVARIVVDGVARCADVVSQRAPKVGNAAWFVQHNHGLPALN